MDSFTRVEKAACIQRIEGWVGLRDNLNAVEKRKISYPCRESYTNPQMYRLSYPGFYVESILIKVKFAWLRMACTVNSKIN
jgi:hypothetical protein